LLTRWFQWGVFNPIFRIHGYKTETEPWKYGSTVEANMRSSINLRYRLIPYIYSEAWQITNHGSTLMRPLMMDFGSDTIAIKQPFEYMFGKAFLVAPVTKPGVAKFDVYLPKTNKWFDFWTGKCFDGGQVLNTVATLSRMPVFVKAGSIVPMGKFVQYTGQKSADTLEIRIYGGANAKFELYEDEGDNYNYENGKYSIIPFEWNEKQQIITIGARQGTFNGFLKERYFNIVRVSESCGAGTEISVFNKLVKYKGRIIKAKK
jgi:alpha-D-xyloside xylohydrolase